MRNGKYPPTVPGRSRTKAAARTASANGNAAAESGLRRRFIGTSGPSLSNPGRKRPTGEPPAAAPRMPPRRAGPLLDRAMVLLGRGRPCDVADRHRSARGGKGRLDELRVALDPAPNRLARDRPAAAVFERPAEVPEVRGERLERRAVLLGVLHAVDVDEQAVNAEIGGVAEVARQELVPDRLAAGGRARHREAAAAAAIRGPLR